MFLRCAYYGQCLRQQYGNMWLEPAAEQASCSGCSSFCSKSCMSPAVPHDASLASSSVLSPDCLSSATLLAISGRSESQVLRLKSSFHLGLPILSTARPATGKTHNDHIRHDLTRQSIHLHQSGAVCNLLPPGAMLPPASADGPHF